jgi:hypothetical protein
VLDGILLERAGIPAVSIITEPFDETGKEMAASWSLPHYRYLKMPHPIANLSEAELNQAADALVQPVLDLLTSGQGG